MIIDLEQITAQSLSPLPGDSPAGENARYEDAYDAVKVEVSKLTALAAGEEGVDWELVVSNSADLLAQKTKDLNLAAFLSLGLLKLEHYAGLLAGLNILLGLMDAFWEDGFPPKRRMKARANTFQWIDERLSEAIEADEPGTDQAEAVRGCYEAAQSLAQKIGEQVDVPVTGLSTLRGALKKWAELMPEPEPEAPAQENGQAEDQVAEDPADDAAPEQAPQTAAPKAQPAPARPAAKFETSEDLASLDDGLTALYGVINTMRGLEPSAALVYRLARVAKWGRVAELPPADGSGRTQIPGPRDEDLQSLSLMAKASNWKDLAEEAESQFMLPGGTFNLDLQRIVHQALSGLGFDEAARSVMQEAGLLINRLPDLKDYHFGDGRAFADPATSDWLAEAGAQAAGPGDGGAAPKSEPWRKEALNLASQGDLAGGLASLQKGVSQAAGLKESLNRRLMAAGLCLDYGKPAWAVPILEVVASETEKASLSDWEPQFCAQVWAGLVRGYQGIMDGDPEPDEKDRQRLENAKRRLFETDLALAAKLSQPVDNI